ncbi:MAG: selenium-dependent molybdenum cofactor biosynthesis protein YqeB [Bacillota bacterium]|nr:selenium-dependent molybdenum cofactor biosynthesis protein YqeB [Bacillota bacterium]MDW7676134.1 selenium-dependent molybdenum cofactor biosynthesis protein YqeB [Bacillota bacterium]
MNSNRVIIRGGGDLATGIAHRLHQAGYQLLITEKEQPSAIRRTVSFANAVYLGTMTVESVTACRANSLREAETLWQKKQIPVMVTEAADLCWKLKADVLVDATLAKKNTGIERGLAPIVIGIGPGFEAGRDVDAVVESQRGHQLGRVLYQGKARPNTGIPGSIAGVGIERLLKAPAPGIFKGEAVIGDVVKAGQLVASVNGEPVVSQIDGLLRGLLADGLSVTAGYKVGDVDPRIDPELCSQISDKARAIGGGVLEAILHLQPERKSANMLDECGGRPSSIH